MTKKKEVIIQLGDVKISIKDGVPTIIDFKGRGEINFKGILDYLRKEDFL